MNNITILYCELFICIVYITVIYKLILNIIKSIYIKYNVLFDIYINFTIIIICASMVNTNNYIISYIT